MKQFEAPKRCQAQEAPNGSQYFRWLVSGRHRGQNRAIAKPQRPDMPYEPRNRKKFFDGLGERRVADALINGEFSGELEISARAWLDTKRFRCGVNWARLGVVAAVVAIVVTIAVGYYQVNPTLVVKFVETNILVQN